MNDRFAPDLQGLIQTIERDIYGQPESVISHLRQLLLRCNSDKQLCYAYEHFGFAYLRLEEHRMSRIFYEEALKLQPANFYVLANLAHAVYELGDKQKGIEYGSRALQLKNESAVAAAGTTMLGTPHGGAKKLVSFSLYGKKAKYCETAILNCLAAKHHLPGFVCRFYVDESVPEDVIRRLRDNSAEVVFMQGPAALFPPTFWRFLALDDKEAGAVLVRDADSIIDMREAYCVNEWIASGKPFHIVRDDCCHTELIHAGLFGAESGIIDNIEQRIAAFITTPQEQPLGRYSDQLFLRTCVWPMVREHALTHDNVYGYGHDVRSVPSQFPGAPGVRNHFMGANYANYRLQVSTTDSFAESVRHHLRLIDETGSTVCDYEMDRVSKQRLEMFLPLSYAQMIETGAWRCEHYSKSGETHPR